jgi:DNA-binding CsgD family transcriptional regulator
MGTRAPKAKKMSGQSARQAGQARPQVYAYARPKRGNVDLARETLGSVVNRFEPVAGALRIIQLEQELEITREGLRSAIRDLAIAHAGQRAIKQEVRSANEKFRSTNCELERSKEELQTLQTDTANLSASRQVAVLQVASLTLRQRQILDLVIAGHPSKNIAADLGISQRTVDNHRAAIMRKTGSKTLPALIRTALAAA